MVSLDKPIVLHYEGSIFSHRVLWYLWLRGIPYDECIQPTFMPREDLELLGVGYRKIPVVIIGKDIYCDSRFIISKLESLYPNSALSPSTPMDVGIRKLFENWTIDGGIFANAVRMIPYWQETSFLSNEAFVDDRQKLMGRRFTADDMEMGRPDGTQHLQLAFDMLESTFLADGRAWILNTQEPSLADIDCVWPFKWLMSEPTMKDSLPARYFNAETYPRVFSWVERFVAQLEKKRKRMPMPKTLDGNTMVQRTLGTSTSPENVTFIDDNSHKLKYGDEVEIFPSDYGHMGKTVGNLVGLTIDEVTICNSKSVRVHFPRWNFSVVKIASKSMI